MKIEERFNKFVADVGVNKERTRKYICICGRKADIAGDYNQFTHNHIFPWTRQCVCGKMMIQERFGKFVDWSTI